MSTLKMMPTLKSIRLLASSCVMCCFTSLNAMPSSLDNEIHQERVADQEESLLMRAIEEGNLKLAQELIKSDIDINVSDEQGFTPLMIAIEKGQTKIARALIKAGADVNAHNKIGQTALHRAACLCQKNVVKALIKAGADIRARDDDSQEPLLFVIKCDDLVAEASTFSKLARKETLKTLIKAGADVNARCKLNRTALMCAVCTKQKNIVKELIKAGADVNAQNNGETAWMMAQERGYQKIADILIRAGAHVEKTIIVIDNRG